jgi:hypothetical protein
MSARYLLSQASRTAVISDCGRFRYRLGRRWGDGAPLAGAVCLAWGANAAELERPQVVLPMLHRLGVELQCLRITRSGHPQHPLMLPSECRLQPFTIAAIERAISSAEIGKSL